MFDLDAEVRALGSEIMGAGWRSKPESDWTPDEHRAYHRWAQRERERLAAMPATVERVDADELDRRRRDDVGAFLRPAVVTLNVDDDTLTTYHCDGTALVREYPGVRVADV